MLDAAGINTASVDAMRVKMAAELNKKKIPLWVAAAKGMTVGSAKYF